MVHNGNPYLLPKRAPLASGDDTFEPKRFRQLIEQLPIGNVGKASQSLYQLLKQMNASVVPVANRIANLEVMLRPLLLALDTLAKGYSRVSLPRGRRSGMESDMHANLCILAAQGYKVVLDQYHHESFTGQFLHKSSRSMALHRVLYFLGRNLLRAYQLYRPAPPHIWHEIHGIYRYAFEQKLVDRAVDSEDPSLREHSSVSDLYKQILLLSLAGPYRLMQGEVVRVYQALSRWAPDAQLLDLGKSNGDSGPFLVDIGIDESPRYMGAERDHQVLSGWVLDTSDMALRLADELEATAALHGAMRPQDAPDKLSPDLLACLMLTWGIGSQRVAERDETQGEVALICGLRAIYMKLGGEQLPETVTDPEAFNPTRSADLAEKPKEASPALLEPNEYVVQEDPQLASIRRWIADNSVPVVNKPAIVPASEIQARPEITEPVAHVCPVYNESSNGFHLGWSADAKAVIGVGELVAVIHRDAGGEESLRLGVVRWMRVDRPDVIDFGLELIMGEVQPVAFCRRWDRGRQEEFRPGLLLQRPHEDQTVITAPFYSEQGQRTWLMTRGKKQRIELSREIEATASFIQFYFHDPDQPKPSSLEAEVDERDFEQLWTSI